MDVAEKTEPELALRALDKALNNFGGVTNSDLLLAIEPDDLRFLVRCVRFLNNFSDKEHSSFVPVWEKASDLYKQMFGSLDHVPDDDPRLSRRIVLGHVDFEKAAEVLQAERVTFEPKSP